ncbi:MAG: hypothetical protein JNL58_04705 [Planctomyces sp.]|nr:hypothetical protein [Planctomyces sp.]
MKWKKTKITAYAMFVMWMLCMSAVAGLIFYRTMVNSIAVQIGAGMTSEDVMTRMGEPFAKTLKGAPLTPPNASGFVPGIKDWHYALTYWKYGKVVYVFFDEQDRVLAVYVCTV